MTRATLLFRVAAAIAVLHALDDAFFNRQPGVPLTQHALAAVIATGAAAAAAYWFPRLAVGVRAGTSLVFGAFALANGVLHVVHVADGAAERSDYTGVLAAGAGLVFVALGLWLPFEHRGRSGVTRGRRWVYRVTAVVVGAVAAYAFVLPTVFAITATHKYREAIGDAPSAAYQDVAFRSSDGLRLSGWYVPSKNRAAVVVVHGGGGDRTGAVRHARLLQRHGYGVLLYDSRGRGESEGPHNMWGWDWDKDVAGALAFLKARDDVDPGRIGGLGLSTGADVLIEVAAERDDVKAVVSDGATAQRFADQRNAYGIDVSSPFFATVLTAGRVLSGASPAPPLAERVREVAPTPLLLIAAGSLASERRFNEVYAAAAREPSELWDLPDVRHTNAISERPREYERRVVGLFDRALLRR